MESVLRLSAILVLMSVSRGLDPKEVPWGPDQAGLIRQGTCGWSDESLVKCGRFYPPSLPSTQKLEFYSRSGLFSCVEVDSSAYAIPSPHTVRGWCDQVPKGFLFHFKAFALFCAQSVPYNALPRAVRNLTCMHKEVTGGRVNAASLGDGALDATWACFNAACLEAHSRGKLGTVVFQFQLGFKPTEQARSHICDCRRRLHASFRMAVEFRDRDWVSAADLPRTRAFLQLQDLSFVICDDLKHELFQPDKHQVPLPPGKQREVLPILLEVTAPWSGVYIRLHRREGTQRVLSSDEFLQWRERFVQLRAFPGLGGPVFFLWGTDHEDQPLINAKRLREGQENNFFNWKAHVQAESKALKGSLLSFFAPPAATTPVSVCTTSVSVCPSSVGCAKGADGHREGVDGAPEEEGQTHADVGTSVSVCPSSVGSAKGADGHTEDGAPAEEGQTHADVGQERMQSAKQQGFRRL